MQTEITKIQTTKQGHYALFCISGFLFSVDAETVIQYDLKKGKVLSEPELLSLEKKSLFQKAKNRALTYLSIRDYGQEELRLKLERFYDKDAAEYAVQKMCDLGFVDDEKFATHRARYLVETRGLSIKVAKVKLQQLNLSKDIIEASLQEFSEEDSDEENAVAFLRKKHLSNIKSGNMKKVLASTQRKGFNYATIKRALNVIFEEENIEEQDIYSEEF